MKASDRIIVPLDVSTERDAHQLAEALIGHVGYLKVGLELMNAVGPHIIRQLMSLGARVFLDGKFMDIPNTVAGASRAASRLKVEMFNVHSLGGTEMMRAAVRAADATAQELNIQRPQVLAVTVLTSIDDTVMNDQLRIPGAVEEQVLHLATLAVEAGVDGVIASPKEIAAIRRAFGERIRIVTPGVRPRWASADDQRRILAPGEAIRLGADYIVVGRPITNPPKSIGSPTAAARVVSDEIGVALEGKEI